MKTVFAIHTMPVLVKVLQVVLAQGSMARLAPMLPPPGVEALKEQLA